MFPRPRLGARLSFAISLAAWTSVHVPCLVPVALAQGPSAHFTADEFPPLFRELLPPRYRDAPRESIPPAALREARAALEASMRSLFSRVTLPVAGPDGQVTTVPYFDAVRVRVAAVDPQARILPSGGVVRSALGYLYDVVYQARRTSPEASVAEILRNFAREISPIPAIDVRGVGSDWDLLTSGGDPARAGAVLEAVGELTNSAEIALGLRSSRAGGELKDALFAKSDTKDYAKQIERSTSQGGSTLDFLAYDLERGRLVEPPRVPGIVDDLILGAYRYLPPASEASVEDAAKQTIRGIRPRLELPFLRLADEVQFRAELADLIQSARAGSLPAPKALEQFAKTTRNSRYSGAANRFYRSEPGSVDALVIEYARILEEKTGQRFLPEYVDQLPVGRKPRRALPEYLFLAGEALRQRVPDLTVYHGTRSLSAGLAILRQGLFISADDQGRAAAGRGGYSNTDRAVAAQYAGSEGIVFKVGIRDDARVRVLDLEHHADDPELAAVRAEAARAGVDFHAYLAREYDVDVIVNDHILLQNVEAIEFPDKLKTLGESYLEVIRSPARGLPARAAAAEDYAGVVEFLRAQGETSLPPTADARADLDRDIEATARGTRGAPWHERLTALELMTARGSIDGPGRAALKPEIARAAARDPVMPDVTTWQAILSPPSDALFNLLRDGSIPPGTQLTLLLDVARRGELGLAASAIELAYQAAPTDARVLATLRRLTRISVATPRDPSRIWEPGTLAEQRYFDAVRGSLAAGTPVPGARADLLRMLERRLGETSDVYACERAIDLLADFPGGFEPGARAWIQRRLLELARRSPDLAVRTMALGQLERRFPESARALATARRSVRRFSELPAGSYHPSPSVAVAPALRVYLSALEDAAARGQPRSGGREDLLRMLRIGSQQSQPLGFADSLGRATRLLADSYGGLAGADLRRTLLELVDGQGFLIEGSTYDLVRRIGPADPELVRNLEELAFQFKPQFSSDDQPNYLAFEILLDWSRTSPNLRRRLEDKLRQTPGKYPWFMVSRLLRIDPRHPLVLAEARRILAVPFDPSSVRFFWNPPEDVAQTLLNYPDSLRSPGLRDLLRGAALQSDVPPDQRSSRPRCAVAALELGADDPALGQVAARNWYSLFDDTAATWVVHRRLAQVFARSPELFDPVIEHFRHIDRGNFRGAQLLALAAHPPDPERAAAARELLTDFARSPKINGGSTRIFAAAALLESGADLPADLRALLTADLGAASPKLPEHYRRRAMERLHGADWLRCVVEILFRASSSGHVK